MEELGKILKAIEEFQKNSGMGVTLKQSPDGKFDVEMNTDTPGKLKVTALHPMEVDQ